MSNLKWHSFHLCWKPVFMMLPLSVAFKIFQDMFAPFNVFVFLSSDLHSGMWIDKNEILKTVKFTDYKNENITINCPLNGK